MAFVQNFFRVSRRASASTLQQRGYQQGKTTEQANPRTKRCTADKEG